LVNGVSVDEVKSTKRGQITIKRLPKTIDLMDVMAVETDDADGNVVFSASF
jgi:cytolysin (calcineurin-like family phosphatase)